MELEKKINQTCIVTVLAWTLLFKEKYTQNLDLGTNF